MISYQLSSPCVYVCMYVCMYILIFVKKRETKMEGGVSVVDLCSCKRTKHCARSLQITRKTGRDRLVPLRQTKKDQIQRR